MYGVYGVWFLMFSCIDWKIEFRGVAFYVNHHTKVMGRKEPERLVADYVDDARFPLPMLQRAAIFLERYDMPVVNVTAFSPVKCKLLFLFFHELFKK
jgi:hypothetical protein